MQHAFSDNKKDSVVRVLFHINKKAPVLSDKCFFLGALQGTRISFCFRKILLICSALGERKTIRFINEKSSPSFTLANLSG